MLSLRPQFALFELGKLFGEEEKFSQLPNTRQIINILLKCFGLRIPVIQGSAGSNL